MTISTYSTNMTDLYAGGGSTSNWSALGGGAAALNAETDYFIQGTGMTSKNAFASTRKGMMLDTLSDRASLIGTDGAVLIWTTHATPNSLDTIANGGIALLVGNSDNAYKHWYVGGSDTIEFMGWILAAVNPSEATDEADQGSPSAVEDHFGILFDLPSGGPTKGSPNAVDAIRVGRCDLIYEFGTSADPDATFQLAVDDKGDVTDRLGLIQFDNGSFFLSGLHQLGSSTNAVNFTDSSKGMFWRDHPAVTAPFNTVDIQNASSVVNMTNISWKALGTKSPGTWLTTDNATVNLTTCNFIDWGEFTFDSNTTVDTCTFLGCGLITLGDATIAGSTVSGSTVAAGIGAVRDARSSTGDTIAVEFDNTTFVQGAAAHHAITFGDRQEHNLTLTGVDFSGFSGTDDVDGSTIKFENNFGSINLNLIGCTVDGGPATQANVGVHSTAGMTVTLVIDPVIALFIALDENTDPLENAVVLVEAADGTGDLPFEDVVTMLRFAQTVNVTHTDHGMAEGDRVIIRGADELEYNGVSSPITNVATNTYDIVVLSSPISPATGTILATGVVVSGTTDVNGEIQDSRTWTQDQPVVGIIRHANNSPFYKPSIITGTISATAGITTTNVMIRDD